MPSRDLSLSWRTSLCPIPLCRCPASVRRARVGAPLRFFACIAVKRCGRGQQPGSRNSAVCSVCVQPRLSTDVSAGLVVLGWKTKNGLTRCHSIKAMTSSWPMAHTKPPSLPPPQALNSLAASVLREQSMTKQVRNQITQSPQLIHSGDMTSRRLDVQSTDYGAQPHTEQRNQAILPCGHLNNDPAQGQQEPA
jgi:hypothetical protein